MTQRRQKNRSNSIKLSLNKDAWEKVGRAAAFLLALGITVGVILSRNQIESFAIYGYPASFLVNLLSNATVFVPVPTGLAVVLVTAAKLNPFGVGIAAGLGSAMGETTGYLAGISGQGIFDRRPIYKRVQELMERSGTLIVFITAFVPNPAFDAVGIMAGAMGMPAWRFFIACFFGKTLRFVLIALLVSLYA